MRETSKNFKNNYILNNNESIVTSQTETSIYEKCVCCGINTQILKSTPIEKRQGYVVGGGQLCWDCYVKLYK